MTISTSTSTTVAIVPEHFDEFRVGQRFDLGVRSVTATDLESFTALTGDANPLHVSTERARAAGFDGPILQGPFGLSAFFGLWFDAGIARDSVIGMLDTNWRYHQPIQVGDEIRGEVTITRRRRTSRGVTGVIGRHITLINQHGSVVQSGTSAFLMEAEPGTDSVGQNHFSREWIAAMASALDSNRAFGKATETWDGTVGLRRLDEIAQFRIYRGRVVEAGTRTPNGPTFCVESDELTWAELFAGPCNDLTVRLMGGDSIRCTGSAYEYLRLTKALSLLVDVARELHATEENS